MNKNCLLFFMLFCSLLVKAVDYSFEFKNNMKVPVYLCCSNSFSLPKGSNCFKKVEPGKVFLEDKAWKCDKPCSLYFFVSVGRYPDVKHDRVVLYVAPVDGSARACSVEISGRGERDFSVRLNLGVKNNAKKIHSYAYNAKLPKSYLFLQQVNDMCIMAPMYNLYHLESLLKKYPCVAKDKFNYDFSCIPESEYLNRRQWFGFADEYLKTWHLNVSSKNLDQYLKKASLRAPLFPNIYKKRGSSLVNLYKEISSFLMNYPTIPFFFVDRYSMQGLKVSVLGLPVVDLGEELPYFGLLKPYLAQKIGDQYYWFVYNKKTREYDSYDEGQFNSYLKSKHGYFEPNSYGPFYGQGWCPLGSDGCCFDPKVGPVGFDDGYFLYYPYLYGFYKLMLLRLGLDRNNKNIKSSDSVHKVYSDLKGLSNKDKEYNLWSDKYFTRDKFLEYALTEILLENKNLCDHMKSVVDFYFPFWSNYSGFLDGCKKGLYCRRDKTKYNYAEFEEFLPGDEQALAYMIMACARYLCIGAISKKALYENIPHIPFMPSFNLISSGKWKFDYDLFKRRAYEKKGGASFMSEWKKLLDLLKAKYLRRNWIEFSGHGVVVSLDPGIIGAQLAKKGVDKATIKDLGFTIIDSSWSKNLKNAFYVM